MDSEQAIYTSPLVKLRSERDSMSAIEKRIADFILDNTQLLRDYSSQQLANAVGISQSSVVKFSQKLGFKGYPDLKYSIGEALARADNTVSRAPSVSADGQASTYRPVALWRLKSEAEEATRLINPTETIEAAATLLAHTSRVFIIGLGSDDIPARTTALRLSMLGMLTQHNFDTMHLTASLSSANPGDALMVFSEYGMQPALCEISRLFREDGGKVITVTRHTSNPLRAHADIPLLVSAHDERVHIEPLLYHSALQHLIDGIFVWLCESNDKFNARLLANTERIHPVAEP
ncbi:MAG TPA: MurR/RpiR family transcriptional regulator [Oleiagrimonas sp.]|nr:MurR/RpiR family transcriptional regulator [Oleiagrimonas sp.]